MVCEVGFAVFAAVDFFGVEVNVVGEAHLGQVVGMQVVVMGPQVGKRFGAFKVELRLRFWDHSAKVRRRAFARYSCVCLRSKAKRSRLAQLFERFDG